MHMPKRTDRTIRLVIRTNGYGARCLFKVLANWIGKSEEYRQIDLFEQRVDGVPMEPDNDNTKELSTEDSLSSVKRH